MVQPEAFDGSRRRGHHEKEIKEESYYRSECDYGTFQRRIPLDFEADPGLIKAVFKDGVLEVRVPILAAKAPPAKEIPIA